MENKIPARFLTLFVRADEHSLENNNDFFETLQRRNGVFYERDFFFANMYRKNKFSPEIKKTG